MRLHFMNRFCCRLWASRLTNIFPLVKKNYFKGNLQKSDISRKLNFAKFATYEALIYKNLPWKFRGRHYRKAGK